jgi:VCBS repeat-containing protein
MDGVGTVVASIVSAAANDAAGNASGASTSTDNTVSFDNVAPTVTIDQASGQADPTNASPILFTVVFSEVIVGFTAEDVSLAGSTVGGTLTASVSGTETTYTVSVTGMDGTGTVVASVVAGAASDAAGNASAASTSTDNTVTFDNVAPTVTIDQAMGQEDPTNDSPILFTVVFSEVITGFTAEDISLAGSTVGGTLTASVSGSGATYTVSVTGMDGVGTVVASVVGGAANDAAGNASAASTSTDNTVTFDNVAPTVTIDQAAGQADPTNASPILFTVVFSEVITGFAAEDISLAGSTVGGTLTAAVSGSGATYTVAVTGMDGVGTVVASVVGGAASDAAGNSSTASTSTDNTVSFNDNEAPLARDDSYTTDEDTVLTVTAPGVLVNDLDEDALEATLVSGPVNGTLTLNANGGFTYTPSLNFNGVDSFTYRASDGSLDGTGVVTITVNALDDAGDARDDSYGVDEDGLLTVVAPGVLGNDIDVDSALTATLVDDVDHGLLAFDSDGSFIYAPDLNFNGTDTFTYRLTDGDIATVTIAVAPVNDAPVAVDDSASTAEDTPVTIAAADLPSNDIDVDGDFLEVSSVGTAGHGTVVANLDGTITYTPGANFHGTDSFEYTVTDGEDMDTGVVTITVTPVNDAPEAVDDSYTTNEGTVLTITAPGVLGNDTDVDSLTLSAILDSGPANGTLVLNADGSFTYTPNAGFSSTDTFTYTVSDGDGGTDTGLVRITVNATGNDAPDFVEIDDRTVTEGQEVRFTVVANDADDPASALTITVDPLTLPAGATFNALTHEFVWIPADDDADDPTQPATVIFTVRDPHGAVDTMDVLLTATNAAPTVEAGANQVVGLQKMNHGHDRDGDGDDDHYHGHGHGNGHGHKKGEAEVSITATFNDLGTLDTHTATIDWGDGHVTTGTVSESPFGPPGSTAGANGTVTGSHTYKRTGVYTVKVTVTDDDGGVSLTDTLTIRVKEPDKHLKAKSDEYRLVEDSVFSIDAAHGVLRNDRAPGNPLLTARLVEGPEHGALTFNADGSFEYRPDANFHGEDSFWYEFTDGYNVSKAVRVELKVRDDGRREACIDWGGRPGWSLPLSGKHPNLAEFLVKLAAKLR